MRAMVFGGLVFSAVLASIAVPPLLNHPPKYTPTPAPTLSAVQAHREPVTLENVNQEALANGYAIVEVGELPKNCAEFAAELRDLEHPHCIAYSYVRYSYAYARKQAK